MFLAPALRAGNAPASAVSGGAEPMILIAPDGASVLIGDSSGLHVSMDHGATWAHRDVPELPGAFTDGRPLALDAAGTLYAADTQGEVIAVSASHDLGKTWTNTNYVVGAAAIADRPWLAAGAAGQVVLVYYATGLGERCVYSNDGGATWITQTLNNGGPSNAGNVILDAQGRVWYAEGGVYLVRWNAPCQGNVQYAYVGGGGAQIFTQVAVNAAGDSFVARPPNGNAQMQLVGMHGMDASTRKTVTVSPPSLHSNSFGSIASRADGSEVAVAWFGSTSAGDPSGAFTGSWDVYVARVTGYWTAAPTITVTKVTTTSNHFGGFCMGGVSCTSGRALLDYMGVTYDPAGNVHVAYGQDTSGSVTVEYAVLPHL